MVAPYSSFFALKVRAAANGITPTQFNEIYQGCHDAASFELCDASEVAKHYMVELWTRSVLCKFISTNQILPYLIDTVLTFQKSIKIQHTAFLTRA